MGSDIYVTIEHSSHSNSLSRRCFGASMERASSEPPIERLRTYCPAQTLLTCWELLFTLLSSVILSAYTLHNEVRVRTSFPSPPDLLTAGLEQSHMYEWSELQIQAFDPGCFNFVLDPSPALMLAFCLVLGCSVSSFCYRHQEQDKFQTPIFVLVIVGATTIGFGLGINANLVMLGLIPWALCFSMVFSSTVHWLVRRCSRRQIYFVYEIDEKEVLFRD